MNKHAPLLKWVLRLALLLTLIGCLSPHLSLAQGGRLTYGETVTGRITKDAFRTVYTFQGRKGDIVDITLSRTNGTLDPVLILLDEQNTLIGRDDDGGAGYDAAIMSQQLPRDGIYFLIVTRFGQEHGLTTGGYSLTLSHIGITDASSTALQYGDSVVGDLKDDQFQSIYVFRAARGDIIRATLQRISGDLDSLLILADAQGNILVSNDEDPDSPGTLDAAISNFRIWQTGNYILVATRFGREAGQSRGGFALTLDRLPPEAMGKVPEKAILIDYGSTSTGTIDASAVMRFYLIQARKGDVLTIDAQRTRGNLDPTLTLYTGDLKELATNDSGIRGQNARIWAFNVPADGNYILMVSRFNRDKGITAGNYSLSVTGRSSVAVGSSGRANLQYNNAANAIINDSNVAQEYTFTGSAGDVVTITMTVTSGNLIGQLLLLDPARKQIAQDDSGTGDARLVRFKLPTTGVYTIVATRHGRDKGNTRGAYLLMLTREAS
jgi:hypothetical protein